MTDPTRGVLYPDRLPSFQRIAPERADLVAWLWVPQWDLPAGAESRQPILAYPAANLVVEPDGATLWGATTRAGERVLTARGWAVGALLRPAALMRFAAAPAELVDAGAVLDARELVHAVSHAMDGADVLAAAAALERWIVERAGALTGEARLANDMAALLMDDPDVLRVEDAAARLAVSVRTLQRLAHRTIGLPPAAVIRRRRLQEAAQRVREHPGLALADVAAELGYADQAHLANDFRAVLGLSPSSYRAAVAPRA